MIVKPIKTRVFKENENLIDFVREHIKKIPEKSVLVITSKILALSEGRVVRGTSKKVKEKLIKSESDFAIKTELAWLTIKDGQVMASAGIDESNAKDALILLPKDSFSSAEYIRRKIMKICKIKNIGVLITDSRTQPLRLGVTGTALGYAGFKGIKNYIGKPDIFGRKFKFVKTNIADCLATSAVLCMGEGKERIPMALIQEAPIEFSSKKANKFETRIDIKSDLYGPLFQKFGK